MCLKLAEVDLVEELKRKLNILKGILNKNRWNFWATRQKVDKWKQVRQQKKKKDLQGSIKIYKGLELKCVRDLIDDVEEKYQLFCAIVNFIFVGTSILKN